VGGGDEDNQEGEKSKSPTRPAIEAVRSLGKKGRKALPPQEERFQEKRGLQKGIALNPSLRCLFLLEREKRKVGAKILSDARVKNHHLRRGESPDFWLTSRRQGGGDKKISHKRSRGPKGERKGEVKGGFHKKEKRSPSRWRAESGTPRPS